MSENHPNPEERSLVTFVLLAYNQEKYIRDAVEGALAQTYSPLEIIISDDCSTDKTFEIIEQVASQYDGPHVVILNKNPKNLGICGHLNQICQQASGHWVIASAGDDYSLPDRTTELMLRAEAYPQATYLMSQALAFSGSRPEDPAGLQLVNRPLGATEAFRLDVFRSFGPIQPETYNEDWTLYFRGQLKGEIFFLRKPLIFYRLSNSSLSGRFYLSSFADTLWIHECNLRQFSADLALLPSNKPCDRQKLALQVSTRLELVSNIRAVATGRRSRFSVLMQLAEAVGLSLQERTWLSLLVLFHECFRLFERLGKTRFSWMSPSRRGLTLLNPYSLLIEPTYVD